MEFATYGNGRLDTNAASDEYWQGLKKQLASTDRKLARRRADAENAENVKRSREAKCRELATIVAAEPIQSGDAIALATTLGISLESWWKGGLCFQDSRYESELEQRDDESEDEFFARLAASCDISHDYQAMHHDHYPACWRMLPNGKQPVTDKDIVYYQCDMAPRAYYAPDSDDYWILPNHSAVYHKRYSGLPAMVSGEAEQYTIEPLPPDGGAYILNGHVNTECLPEQMATIKQDAIEDLANALYGDTVLERLIALNKLCRAIPYKMQARRNFVSDTTDTQALADKARQTRLAAYLERH